RTAVDRTAKSTGQRQAAPPCPQSPGPRFPGKSRGDRESLRDVPQRKVQTPSVDRGIHQPLALVEVIQIDIGAFDPAVPHQPLQLQQWIADQTAIGWADALTPLV